MGSAKVTVDVSGVPTKTARLKADPTLGLFLATEAMRGMNDYVPFRTGYLSRSARAEPWAVTYSTSYARRVYYGTHLSFSRQHHGLATARWGDVYASAHAADLARAATRYLRG